MSRRTRILNTLKRTGEQVTLRSVATATKYDPTKGSVSPTESNGPRHALLLDMLTARPLAGFGSSDHLKTDIEGVRKWAFMDAVGVAPKTQDKVITDLLIFDVINVQSVSDASGSVLYVLALKY